MIVKLNIFVVYLLFMIVSALPAKNSDSLINSNIDTIGIAEEVLSTKEPQKRQVDESKSVRECKRFHNELCKSSTLIQLVLDGTKAAHGEFPHMVALGSLNSDNTFDSVCGGTLISEQWVLTAAHCIGMTHGLLGTNDLKHIGNGEVIKIDDVQRYPGYKSSYFNNDIALVKLSKKVPFHKYLRPACLYQAYDSSPQEITATGWGLTENEETADKLLKIRLDVVSNVECTEKYAEYISTQQRLLYGIAPSMLCAADKIKGTKDTCNGDSGGPIKIGLNDSCLYEVVGVTSFGEVCLPGRTSSTDAVRPGVYTRVSHFLDWIEDIVWP